MAVHHHLAFDLGAESGRLMLGSVEDRKLTLRELHRFPNTPLRHEGSLCWNMHNLVIEVKDGELDPARDVL